MNKYIMKVMNYIDNSSLLSFYNIKDDVDDVDSSNKQIKTNTGKNTIINLLKQIQINVWFSNKKPIFRINNQIISNGMIIHLYYKNIDNIENNKKLLMLSTYLDNEYILAYQKYTKIPYLIYEDFCIVGSFIYDHKINIEYIHNEKYHNGPNTCIECKSKCFKYSKNHRQHIFKSYFKKYCSKCKYSIESSI